MNFIQNIFSIKTDPSRLRKHSYPLALVITFSYNYLYLVHSFIYMNAGKRACLGESLAKMEFYLFAAALLQKFKFKFPANQPQPTLEPHCGGVLSPKPYEILFELRN